MRKFLDMLFLSVAIVSILTSMFLFWSFAKLQLMSWVGLFYHRK